MRDDVRAVAPQASILALEPVGELDELRDEWTELAHASGNIFSTWEWASAWWRHGVGGRPLLLYASREDDGRLGVMIPLYLWSARPLRVARFLGHGPADQLGPLSRAPDRARAGDALRHVVAEARLDVLLAELLPGGEGWSRALGSPPLLRESSPTLSLDGGWEAYLAQRSRNLRQQVRRRERLLASRHPVRLRLTSDPERLQDDLTLLFSLHVARWGKRRSAFTRWEDFHREFATVALERGWLRLWFLELDGQPAAAWYGFRFAGIESYYQAGWDPNRSDESVGFCLLAHSIREAAEDGMREYRFLRGAEPFKLRFANADPGLETIALVRGTKGRIAAAVAARGLPNRTLRSVFRCMAGRSSSRL